MSEIDFEHKNQFSTEGAHEKKKKSWLKRLTHVYAFFFLILLGFIAGLVTNGVSQRNAETNVIEATAEEINAAMKEAAEGALADTFEYTEDPIVSVDIIGSTAGSIFDAQCTKVLGGNMVKVVAWYDNENSYVSQFVRLAKFIAGQIK